MCSEEAGPHSFAAMRPRSNLPAGHDRPGHARECRDRPAGRGGEVTSTAPVRSASARRDAVRVRISTPDRAGRTELARGERCGAREAV